MKVKEAVKSAPLVGDLVKLLRKKINRIEQARQRFNTNLFRILCAELPQIISNPVFVKVGAHDGITGDPCSDILIADARWKGLLIEPVPYLFARLKENFSNSARFALEQVAVGPKASRATFYCMAAGAKESLPDLQDFFDQLGSFDKQHIFKHYEDLESKLEPFITEIEVEVLPLPDILQRNHIQDCHLLHIDTEGYDYKVLSTLNFSVTRPFVLFIEHKHLGARERQDLRRLLHKHNYIVRDCGQDYFAIDKRAKKVLRKLESIVPNRQ